MAFDLSTLDAPFAALAAYDWGGDAAPLATIDQAVIAAHTDQPLRADLEKRLGAILGAGPGRAAKEYACRKLMMIGTAASVPLLAALLKGEAALAAAAAEALGSIGSPEALAALAAADPMAAGGVGKAVIDARLACAERLLAAGKRAEARAVYQALADIARGKPAAKAVELAATRGILACLDTSAAAR